jgi:hypothetical protein
MAIKLQPNPTFKAKVLVHIPGNEPEPVEFTFKHRGRKALKDYAETMQGKSDAELIMDLATGWDLADTFNAENVGLLADNYLAAPGAVWDAYLAELTKAKEKN